MTMAFENWESDDIVDQLLGKYDETVMPLPDIEFEPHLLISKVRKHYMEYMIKLLSINYETNQKLLNKNIYLPSAIWRCAKAMEMTAAQACMVVQIYRKNIISVVKELKADTKKGKMFKKLYECLSKPPVNEKKTQATMNNSADCSCQCMSVKRKRRLKTPTLPKCENMTMDLVITDDQNVCNEQFKIPVAINLQSEPAQPLIPNEFNFNTFSFIPPKQQTQQQQTVCNQPITSPPKTITPVETQDSDELMMQLEKLFQSDPNDDDIFAGALCDTLDADTSYNIVTDNTKKVNETSASNSVIENHAAQIKSLDERLATLAGLLVNNNDSGIVANDSNVPEQKSETPKSKKQNSSKWLCEEYFLKQRLYELLDHIGDTNRKDLARIKEKFAYLFGNDSDDEDVLSPLEESAEFVISCKERIAPWVVKLLTPYYIKGRIRGKALFKSLAKHLIRLIYQCSKYPEEYEVNSFVSDFLENHKMIRCEADFKQFRIDNI